MKSCVDAALSFCNPNIVMFSQNNGGLANGYLARNNIDPTAGVRFRF